MQNETKSKLQLVSGKIIVTEKVRLIIRHKKKSKQKNTTNVSVSLLMVRVI